MRKNEVLELGEEEMNEYEKGLLNNNLERELEIEEETDTMSINASESLVPRRNPSSNNVGPTSPTTMATPMISSYRTGYNQKKRARSISELKLEHISSVFKNNRNRICTFQEHEGYTDDLLVNNFIILLKHSIDKVNEFYLKTINQLKRLLSDHKTELIRKMVKQKRYIIESLFSLNGQKFNCQ